jgi:hypothetical protein
MIPKGKLLALLLAFTAVGGIAATGAFTTVEAERTADVNVDGDANALLAIEPIPATGESDFIGQPDTDNEPFQLVLDEAVNARASTTAEDLFRITNQGAEPVDLWIATQGGEQAGNSSVDTEFYISSEHIVSGSNSPADESGNVQLSDEGSSNDPKPLISDIDEYNAFVDGDGDTSATETDIIISEEETDSSADQSPGDASAVSIAPGESIRVSFAVEIEGNANDLVSGGNSASVLENIVIYAVNDNEDGSATIDQDLTTQEGGEGETTTTTTPTSTSEQ